MRTYFRVFEDPKSLSYTCCLGKDARPVRLKFDTSSLEFGDILIKAVQRPQNRWNCPEIGQITFLLMTKCVLREAINLK